MWSAILVLALVVAMDPVRIGITALLLSRARPVLNLFVFWLGGIAAGIAVAILVLLWQRDFALSVMRVLVSAVSGPTVAHIQVAVGVLAVVVAARMWARQHAPVSVTGDEALVAALQQNTSTRTNRLSMSDRLQSGSLAVAFVAGLALATPPVEYLAALITILASTATTSAQVGAALMFTLVAFTVVEVPLISYLTTPAKTLTIVQRLNDWTSAHRQAIPAVVVGAVGVLLMVTGMGNV
jgi:hypothetical protein